MLLCVLTKRLSRAQRPSPCSEVRLHSPLRLATGQTGLRFLYTEFKALLTRRKQLERSEVRLRASLRLVTGLRVLLHLVQSVVIKEAYPYEADGRNYDNMRNRVLALAVVSWLISTSTHDASRPRRAKNPVEVDA